jgi:hypothetical protein
MIFIYDIVYYQCLSMYKQVDTVKLAEMAYMPLNYLAILELARKFSFGEMLERLAEVLENEPYILFFVGSSPQNEMEQL